MESNQRIRPIPFQRIKRKISDYVYQKLQEKNVILGVCIREKEIRYVASYWMTSNGKTTHYYEMYPYIDESGDIDIRGEEDDYRSEREVKKSFDYPASEYLHDMLPENDYQAFWYISDDIANCWGSLEVDAVTKFLKEHSGYTVRILDE